MNYRWDDEFSCEEANSWQGTISNEREGCERVNNGVYVSHSLQPFEAASSETIP